ncbi:SafA/ExsA family spore coat assembly protein [Acetivibrio clariflavus]|uniref:SafA/ExsA family spore coat assembly protein n=1 Tax=Acetivibrio clariflavus TaxID=288965 RepID=UPI000481FC7C|nr:SafA/ExsA family spore coat assembly protein [Acetivibrio clariflavus]
MKKRLSLIFLFIFIFSVNAFAQSQTYIVKPGDTMWKIANKFQVGTSEIIAANPQIKNPDLIYPGQKITIPNLDDVKALENEVIRLVNVERAKAGLPQLTQNWQLSRVARYKSQDMIDKGYFAHNSPTYGSPFKMMESFGIRYSAAGENIAMGQQSPSQVMNAWMNSPGHRNNILSPSFTQIGVGLAKDKNGRMYWTQMFIKPL